MHVAFVCARVHVRVAVSAPGVWHVSGETCLVVTDLEGKPLHWWKLNKNARTVVSN